MALPDFPKDLVTAALSLAVDIPSTPFTFVGHRTRAERLREIGSDDKEIMLAREKLGVTLWDDLDEQDTNLMLQDALPERCQRGACPLLMERRNGGRERYEKLQRKVARRVAKCAPLVNRPSNLS